MEFLESYKNEELYCYLLYLQLYLRIVIVLIARELRGANVNETKGVRVEIGKTGTIAMQTSADTIIITTTTITSPKVSGIDARDALQYALQFEPFHMYQEDGQICVGNPLGLGILEQLHELKQNILFLQQMVVKAKRWITFLQ